MKQEQDIDMIKQFWTKVKARRTKMGISQEDMAKYLDVSQPGYKWREDCKSKNLPLELADKIAMILKTDVEELLGAYELSTQHLSDEVKVWVGKPESAEWITKAYYEYLAHQEKQKAIKRRVFEG